MTDDVWSRDEIESPCVKVCIINPQSRLCMGCYRSIDEIKDWSVMSPLQRRTIMDALPAREAEAKPKRRGGRSRTKAPE